MQISHKQMTKFKTRLPDSQAQNHITKWSKLKTNFFSKRERTRHSRLIYIAIEAIKKDKTNSSIT